MRANGVEQSDLSGEVMNDESSYLTVDCETMVPHGDMDWNGSRTRGGHDLSGLSVREQCVMVWNDQCVVEQHGAPNLRVSSAREQSAGSSEVVLSVSCVQDRSGRSDYGSAVASTAVRRGGRENSEERGVVSCVSAGLGRGGHLVRHRCRASHEMLIRSRLAEQCTPRNTRKYNITISIE
ncbi:unnamed protein product [Arctia plantaginis]|uniref:Uncharacterized protein n=1 Tax=Arctia plantaginis TaxID=874455 RepID=A0A8S0Z5I9_ARCPL|nr:unnamed protein product [Arctia plantaginis]CAB3228181.1 unnamed protein product [Arctia plantaginis]